jgi:hypothetical protein
MAEFNIQLPDMEFAVRGEVLHKPGAIRLDNYPLLVYAPTQWGEGIRTEDVGASVEDICLALSEGQGVHDVAKRFETTPAHVVQAAVYARAASEGRSP